MIITVATARYRSHPDNNDVDPSQSGDKHGELDRGEQGAESIDISKKKILSKRTCRDSYWFKC